MKEFGREKSGFSAAETEDKTRELTKFIESVAADYRGRYNLPIRDNGRLDMSAYKTLYSDVDRDIQEENERLREWYGAASDEMAEQERLRHDGEKLEMLAYAIFYKNLGEKFIVARASHHDDRTNNVDTIILDRETGNLVCAFDEVGDTAGVDYEKKQAATRDHNFKGGAFLKYGLSVEEKGGEKIISRKSVRNIPLFYIALPKDRIEKGIREFIPSFDTQSEFETKLFEYFIATISAQIQSLELYGGRLDNNLKKKLTDFKKVVEEFKGKGGP